MARSKCSNRKKMTTHTGSIVIINTARTYDESRMKCNNIGGKLWPASKSEQRKEVATYLKKCRFPKKTTFNVGGIRSTGGRLRWTDEDETIYDPAIDRSHFLDDPNRWGSKSNCVTSRWKPYGAENRLFTTECNDGVAPSICLLDPVQAGMAGNNSTIVLAGVFIPVLLALLTAIGYFCKSRLNSGGSSGERELVTDPPAPTPTNGLMDRNPASSDVDDAVDKTNTEDMEPGPSGRLLSTPSLPVDDRMELLHLRNTYQVTTELSCPPAPPNSRASSVSSTSKTESQNATPIGTPLPSPKSILKKVPKSVQGHAKQVRWELYNEMFIYPVDTTSVVYEPEGYD